MLRAYKYRIYPNRSQQELIDKTFGCTRLVYNLALATKIEAYRSARKNLSVFDLINQLPELKEAFPFLSEVDSQSLQASIKKLDITYKNFFKNGYGYPKFKSKHNKQSFQCPNNKREVDFEKSTLTIPKIKDIPIRIDRQFKGQIKTVTISRTTTGKYFSSILVDNKKELPKKQPIKNTKGIDLGLKHFIITDDGIKVDNPKYLKEALQRLNVLQRRASRKKKGSKNRKKANLRVAMLHERIANKRLDFIHKVTSNLINDNQVDTFIMEDLNVKGMMSNHKLAHGISDVGWSKFKNILQYKCDWYGKNLITINRFEPTSKMCSNCGYIKKDLTLADRIYECVNCSNVIDRDVNAAINIKNFGLKQSGEGIPEEPLEMSALAESMKEEIRLVQPSI